MQVIFLTIERSDMFSLQSKPTLETEKLEKGTCVLPKPLDLPPRALWIGASHDITFVKFDKVDTVFGSVVTWNRN